MKLLLRSLLVIFVVLLLLVDPAQGAIFFPRRIVTTRSIVVYETITPRHIKMSTPVQLYVSPRVYYAPVAPYPMLVPYYLGW